MTPRPSRYVLIALLAAAGVMPCLAEDASGDDPMKAVGYVSFLRRGDGESTIRRGQHVLPIRPGAGLQALDVVVIARHAEVEVQIPQDAEPLHRLTSADSPYTVPEPPARPQAPDFIERVRTAWARIAQSPPTASGHVSSKGAGACETALVQAPLRAVPALAEPLQLIDASTRSLAVAWQGGTGPYTVRVDVPSGAASERRTCDTSLGNLSVDLAGAAGPATVDVIDATGSRVRWTVQPTATPAAPQTSSAGDPHQLALAQGVHDLLGDDPHRQLAGFAALSQIAGSDYIADRLVEAVIAGLSLR